MTAARSEASLVRRCLAEFVGTAFVLLAIVGSGIAAEQLSPSQPGVQLLANAIATGLVLAVAIAVLGFISGAHLNPLVSISDRYFKGMSKAEAIAYSAAQLSGAIVGVILANAMFSLGPVSISTHVRGGPGQLVSEGIATMGLMLVVFGLTRSKRPGIAPAVIGGYIAAAVLWSSSTSFANPAVTIARSLTDTFAGIAPASVFPFLIAQSLGAAAAILLARRLFRSIGRPEAERFVSSHGEAGPT